ncbi:MAG: AAA family ATPase [bacterium]
MERLMINDWMAVFDYREGGMDISRHFARFMLNLAGENCPELYLAAGLVSRYTEEGHVCLDLSRAAGQPLAEVLGGVECREKCPPLPHWIKTLRNTSVVGSPGEFKPLILDNAGRLYLYRYWEYERIVAESLAERAARLCPDLDEALLEDGLNRLFPDSPGSAGECESRSEPNWQRIAALTAVRRMFCVISGGPGAGKTSTVVKVLALLLEQARGKPLRLALAAPTGKAANRLRESIRQTRGKLACPPEIRSLIPDEVSTIHRLLGIVRTLSFLRYHENNPLPYDVVVVDEASMIDLPLMARLVRAVSPKSRLIILGDKDQLASVEAGTVLSDICGLGPGWYSSRILAQHPQQPQQPSAGELPSAGGLPPLPAMTAGREAAVSAGTEQATAPGREPATTTGQAAVQGKEVSGKGGLRDSLVILGKSYRFGSDSGIGLLSRSINAGEGERALSLLKGLSRAGYRDISWRRSPPPGAMAKAIAERVIQEYAAYLTVDDPDEAFRRFSRFRLLCAVRQGAYGANQVNALIEDELQRAGLINARGRRYRGQPVMITCNDYQLGLFNGDVGLILPDPASNGALAAYFPTSDGAMRKIPPGRLPGHEAVYAMTVHKSQGSEFDRVLLLLPDTDARILTRELIYTSITRARNYVEVWGREEVFLNAVSRRIQRQSGLQDALWG